VWCFICENKRVYTKSCTTANYRANIYACKELGVERILSWTGPGSLSANLKPGEFVIPTDVLDLTKARKHTFFENAGLGFVRQHPVFCPEVSAALAGVLEELNLKFHFGGTYACTEGPRLETPAEIKVLSAVGADMVGMTLVPEVFLAKELEICYCALCYITNYAEGVKELPYAEGVLFEGMLPETEKEEVERAISMFPAIVKRLALALDKVQRQCMCKSTMERYRREGRAGDNWKMWILHGC
jgi:5'-methylthioadenosine phosphorylase